MHAITSRTKAAAAALDSTAAGRRSMKDATIFRGVRRFEGSPDEDKDDDDDDDDEEDDDPT